MNDLPYWEITDGFDGRDEEAIKEAKRIENEDRESRYYRTLMENVLGSRYRPERGKVNDKD